ncbi:murein biosynthesis integral membrane protein MurJ [Roseomonas terrae]|jgi:putative peptidoglycan lipid II flippase|uniref:Probable lipid II flippase MurJ n=1 Tax=Neoroseomonas terrae TaxID=424799 RepID=A0ABS5EDP7_9PROT|nr:murein biosynthesis integral membrane protein MurJ [Neoroseomonas terrae]MBR0649138.1 murein biosynthesis integral membrane protein MurJ [Neoroseomonas terrae]
MLRSVLTVGGWTMASRVLGFARDMLIAARLGAGPVADAFFVALKLPNLFRRLFGEGAFNAAFIPAFAGSLVKESREAAQDLAERMGALLGIWLGLLTVLGLIFMPQLLVVLAPGFQADPAKFELAVELTRITMGYLPLICLTALVSGVLNGLDRFAAAAAAPVFFNLLLMAALVGLTPYVATPGHALAWGVLASGVVQLAMVWVAARQAGMMLNLLRPPALTPPVRNVLRRMGPGLLGAGVTQINLAVDVIIASLLPSGAVSFLYYADRVAQLPLGVVGAALGTAMLPLLSRQLRAGHTLAAHRSMNRGTELALLLTLPSAVGLAAAADPIVAALFQRGAFGAEAAAASAAALVAYAFGLPAFVLVKVFAPGFFARGDTSAPVKIGVTAVALNLALNLLFMNWLAHVGIALATACAAWVNAGLLAFVLARRGHFVADRRARRVLPRIVAASVVMGAVVVGIAALLPGTETSGGRVLQAVLLIVAGAAAYVGAGVALRAFNLREVLGMLRRRRA